VSRAYGVLGPGGMLRLLHVFNPHPVLDDQAPTGPHHVAAQLRMVEASTKRLRALAQNEAKGTRVEYEMIEHRDHALAVDDAAERFEADVVCLALSNGPTFLTLFRSQIPRILAKARRPLLVVQATPP